MNYLGPQVEACGQNPGVSVSLNVATPFPGCHLCPSGCAYVCSLIVVLLDDAVPGTVNALSIYQNMVCIPYHLEPQPTG